MGYKIQYGAGSIRKYPKVRKKTDKGKMIVAAVLMILIIVGFVPLHRSGVLKELLIPGDAAITQAAAEVLAENLKVGMPVKEAVTIFCREIIAGAGIY